jgi:NodT family efflux transporter outer membrane factor (OMF) lipoprotein
VAEANLKAQRQTLQLTRWLFQAGLSDELAMQQACYNMEGTHAQIPALRSGLEAAENRIAVLLGKPPGAVQAELEDRKPIPVPPVEIAVGVPADTLRQRPDVRRAEQELAAQTARVGVATADLYPKLSLLGSIGLESLSVGNLFSSGSGTYGIGPSITWPVFRAGALRQKVEVESARQEQALARWESAVLSALEEVENALKAFAEEQKRRESLDHAAQAARRAVALSEHQFEAGHVDFNSVLDSQRSLLSFQDQLTQSQGAATGNLVRLYKALGGGWSPLATEDRDPSAREGRK